MAPKKTKMALADFLGDTATGSWADEMDAMPSGPGEFGDDVGGSFRRGGGGSGGLGGMGDRGQGGFGDRSNGELVTSSYSLVPGQRTFLSSCRAL